MDAALDQVVDLALVVGVQQEVEGQAVVDEPSAGSPPRW
jgi:hypothetical protein